MKTDSPKFMKDFFKLQERGTTVKTEIIAGLTTFMTMAYILAVNPNILGESGMDKTAVFTATVLCSTISTLLMGLLANLPFVLSAGMGLNAYFTYTVVMQMGCSWQLALAAVFVEGIIFIFLSLTNIREAIFNAIPTSLKLAISVGIGLFIALIGLKTSGVLVSNPATYISLTSFKVWSPQVCSALLSIIGVILTAVLMHKRIIGNILLGILATWILGILFEITGLYVPDGIKYFSVIPNKIATADITVAPTFLAFVDGFKSLSSGIDGIINFMTIVFAFLFVDMFDTIATLIGCASSGNMLDKDNKLPGIKGALLADAVGTTLGAMLGTSTVTTVVDSTAGIAVGGRTGLTAITASFLFFLSLFLSPVFLSIPSFATTPALVIVGFLMIKEVLKINFEDTTEAVPAFLAFISMPYFYSISEGISVGIISYTLINFICGKSSKLHPLMYVLTLLFISKYILI